MEAMKKITVFTPTYNRAHTLPRLYASLCAQSCKDFEWIVVDDGSTDDTCELMEKYVGERILDIRFIVQSNGGQYRAMNRGIQAADSELFSRCDSDDYLPPDAIETILEEWERVKDDSTLCGIVGNCAYVNGRTVGVICRYERLRSDFLSYRSRLKIKGDRSEIVRTAIMKQYLYPEFEGENTMPIALSYYRIAQRYDVVYFNAAIYIADYLPDGMGASVMRDRKNSPRCFMLHYAEIVRFSSFGSYKLKAALNYWRTSFYVKRSLSDKIEDIRLFNLVWMPFGWLIYKLGKI